MKRSTSLRALFAAAAVFASTTAALAEGTNYAFKVGQNVVYAITVHTELPDKTTDQLSYVMYAPTAVDANGQTTLKCYYQIFSTSWTTEQGTSSQGGGTPWFFAKDPPKYSTPTLVINHAGAIVRSEAGINGNQLDNGLGSAMLIMLQPLPDGQTSWATHRQVTLYRETKTQNGNGGFWGQNTQTTRVESPAEETVTYTAAAPQGGNVTIQRKLDRESLEKLGDVPREHLTGDGLYAFDQSAGLITTLELKFTNELNERNVNVKVPCSVSAHLLTADEIAKLQADADEKRVKEQANLERMKKEQKNDVRDLPDGMAKTDMLGATEGGGPFMKVDPDHRPLLGFKISTGEWFGHKRFRKLDPLWEKPTDKQDDETVIMAKDGYAVGAIIVNATDSVYAVCVTFMKKTDTGLDPKNTYSSPWYGAPIDSKRKTLTGGGQTVYGLFGRKGLNVDAVGLVTAEVPSTQPAGDTP